LGYRPITRFFATRSFLSLQSVPIASVSFDGFSPAINKDEVSSGRSVLVRLIGRQSARLALGAFRHNGKRREYLYYFTS
jgi:hypothetical protein